MFEVPIELLREAVGCLRTLNGALGAVVALLFIVTVRITLFWPKSND